MDQNTTVKDLSWFKSHDQGMYTSVIARLRNTYFQQWLANQNWQISMSMSLHNML